MDKGKGLCRALLTGTRIAPFVVACTLLILGCNSNAKQGSSSGAFSSWRAQLALARAEAAKIDKSAIILASVLTNPINCLPGSAEAVDEDFWFLRSHGPNIRITIRDTNPPSLVSVDPQYVDPSKGVATVVPNEFEAVANSIQISPREACQATLEDAQKTLRQTDVNPTVDMFVDRPTQAQFGVPSAWEVNYRMLNEHKNGVITLPFEVSAQTGDILKQYPVTGDGDAALTPTP